MFSNSKKLNDSRLELTINLDTRDLKQYLAEAEKRLANNLRLPGFRPGRVPPRLARERLGLEKIQQEAMSLAVQSSLAEALAKNKIEVVSPPAKDDLEIKENSPDKLIYKVILTVFPEVKLGRYSGLKVRKNKAIVGESEVKNVLEDLRETRTQRQSVDRPAQLGDRVEVDFEITLDGRLVEGGKSENHPLTLGKKSFVPGFEESLVGMEPGQEKKFSLKVPADYYQKELSGREIKVRAVLKRVESLTPPELNDDFAKSLGHFNNLKELEANLRQGLFMEKETRAKEKTRLEILNQITASSTLEVPPVLIEQQLDVLIRKFDDELHHQGMELGPYLAHLNKTQDDLRSDWRNKAESQTKTNLIIRAIAKVENIKVSDQEVSQELVALADRYAREGLIGELQNADPEIVKSRLGEAILREKVFEFLEKTNEAG